MTDLVINTRAALRVEIEAPLDRDFNRREKDGVPFANDPFNVRLSLFRMGVYAARGDDGTTFLVRPHPTRPGQTLLQRVTKERLAELRFDIHRSNGFLPGKALVKDVVEDVARAYDVMFTEERGVYLD